MGNSLNNTKKDCSNERNSDASQPAIFSMVRARFIVSGGIGVGKTSLLRKEATGDFMNNFVCTIGIDFHVKVYQIFQKTIKAMLWDTGGMERFRRMNQAYYRRASGLLICFDVTDEGSFNEVSFWYESAIENNVDIMCLVACKADLQEIRVVSEDRGKELAAKYNMPYYETSAKTGKGVNECFEQFIRYWYSNRFDLERDVQIFLESGRIFIHELEFTDPIIDIIWSMLFMPQETQMLRTHPAVYNNTDETRCQIS